MSPTSRSASRRFLPTARACSGHSRWCAILLIFTDRRFIMVDRQGVTGMKTEYHSILYRAVTRFSVETAGPTDLALGAPHLGVELTDADTEDLPSRRRDLRGPAGTRDVLQVTTLAGVDLIAAGLRFESCDGSVDFFQRPDRCRPTVTPSSAIEQNFMMVRRRFGCDHVPPPSVCPVQPP